MKSDLCIFFRVLLVPELSLYESVIPLAEERFEPCFKLASERSEARLILSEDELRR